ncbi:GTPase-associated protein 1-related protein [Streptomyces fulvoviolaceus]|uniref:GTPase-associated protein 1-related protein n=1 Tax=Streptomyces fulvoviolaceus TaxID=285535 RepID=UPI0021BF50C9|nr:GTPase-associated protein 1-related protein [Streptomyces fulvoviolaceus]MCT9075512.1 GTPase-associated protein 1-related protein [Streptomyces fulvoviolaceus]
MTLAQLHYTSAPPGPDGSGFRFTAVSAGVSQGLLREAEQLIGYEPPRDFPARPDTEQLRSFPKALSFSELSDGGRLLSRSVYTGADYSGRWGNFHAHALHLPPGARLPAGALPITAWESPRWAGSTPPGGHPEPIDRFESSGLIHRDSLVAFAVSRTDRLAAFFADLRVLAEDPDAGQIVLVENDSADVARWITLACAVLPRERAHRLTFTTYTRRPQQARQQIIGALPSSESVTHDHRYRVHDCTGRAPSAPVTDAWADLCARIWCAGRPELFQDAHLEVGPLAVTALVAGIELDADGRTAAARWAAEQAGALPHATLAELVGALCADGKGAAVADSGADGEQAALAALLARIEGQLPTSVTAALAARVLASAVLSRGPVPALRAGSLTPETRAGLARDLAPAIRSGIDDVHEPAVGRPLALLRIADLLDVDCQDLLPELAGRLARALVTEPPTDSADRSAADSVAHPAGYGPGDATSRAAASGRTPTGVWNSPSADAPAHPAAPAACPPALLDAVHEHPSLRIALFASLDALAAADPQTVARMLGGAGLPVELQPGNPHLRMCVLAGAARGSGSRLARFHELLRAAGVSPHADTTLLRTALRLVWSGELPTGEEASRLLNELGSDIHRSAGTRDLLIDAALTAPPEDRDVPALAVELLTAFSAELRPGQRAALLLLEYVRLLGTEGEGDNWVTRVLQLRDSATEPVPDTVTDRVFGMLAWRLVKGPTPESELYALVRSAEPRLFAAYERAGRLDRVGDRLRTVPSYAAQCFSAWSAFPGTHPAWDEARNALLTKVLRPIVRALPAEDVVAVEQALGSAGRGRLDAFRTWNRPGTLGRLAGRLSGRGRRGEQPSAWHADVEPPSDGGRR